MFLAVFARIYACVKKNQLNCLNSFLHATFRWHNHKINRAFLGEPVFWALYLVAESKMIRYRRSLKNKPCQLEIGGRCLHDSFSTLSAMGKSQRQRNRVFWPGRFRGFGWFEVVQSAGHTRRLQLFLRTGKGKRRRSFTTSTTRSEHSWAELKTWCLPAVARSRPKSWDAKANGFDGNGLTPRKPESAWVRKTTTEMTRMVNVWSELPTSRI